MNPSLLQREISAAHVRGWRMTRLNGKIPVNKAWQKNDASPGEVEAWAASGKNVGVRTGKASGVVVIDLDNAKGCKLTHADFPATWTVDTGGGGKHLFYRRPDVEKIGQGGVKKAFGPDSHVDIRGDGAQAVMVGSVHPETGKVYQWMPGRSPDDLPLADFPTDVLAKLMAPPAPPTPVTPKTKAQASRSYAPANGPHPYVKKLLDEECAILANLTDGRKTKVNELGLRVGHFVSGGHVSRPDAEAQIGAAAQACGCDGWEERLRRALDDGEREPRHPPAKAVVHRSAKAEADAVVVPDKNPLTLAGAFLEKNAALHLARWRDEFHTYFGGMYRPWGDEDASAACWNFLNNCVVADESGGRKPVVPRRAMVSEVKEAIGVCSVLPTAEDAPMWRDGRKGMDPREIVALRNGLHHLPSNTFMPHDPNLFTQGAADFDYAADAPDPGEWFKFVRQILGHDPAGIDLLQEWMGYCLGYSAWLQKMLLVVGPKRSGKGTLAAVMESLVGHQSVAGPTLGSLGQNFGLASLIGKRVGIIGDARLGGRADQGVVCERLLTISAGDIMDIDRKNREMWTGRLFCRVMMLSNELPRIADAAGALSSRFLVLTLVKSFYGQEDTKLAERIIQNEMPGVYLWALEGWRRLQASGKFTEPESCRLAKLEMEDLGSPVAAFLREKCKLESDTWATTDDLFTAWKSWCEEEGRTFTGTKGGFGKDLHAVTGIKKIEKMMAGDRFKIYPGIRLRYAHEKDDSQGDSTLSAGGIAS